MKNKNFISKTQTTKIKKRLMQIGIFLTFIYVIYAIFPKKEIKPIQNKMNYQPPLTDIKPPQLALTKVQIEKLNSAINELKKPLPENEEDKLLKMRMTAPTTVYSESPSSESQKTSVIHATQILKPSTTLAQGSIIAAILETRIVSDLPGMVRAITSEDVYSENGENLLLPKGSRLIGQYRNSIVGGQNRIFIIWARLIRPDHVDIKLNSPGTDALGGAGLNADIVEKHFFDQFGNSVLLSLIGAGASNIGVSKTDQYNSASAYRESISNSFNQAAQTTLQNNAPIKPTLYINQGTKVDVIVSKDLEFS